MKERRSVPALRRLLVVISVVLLSLTAAPCQEAGDIKPAPYQVSWQDLEFGVIVHFSTNTFLDREWGDGTASPVHLQSDGIRSGPMDEGHPRCGCNVRRPGSQAP